MSKPKIIRLIISKYKKIKKNMKIVSVQVLFLKLREKN